MDITTATECSPSKREKTIKIHKEESGGWGVKCTPYKGMEKC